MTDPPIDREAVVRYYPDISRGSNPDYDDAVMVVHPQGAFVSYADYRALLDAKEAAEAKCSTTERTLDWTEDRAKEYRARAEAAEAKLAVAVEGLERIGDEAFVSVATPKEMYQAWRAIAVDRIDMARTILAQIKETEDD